MDIILRCGISFLIGGAFCLIAQILIDKTKLTPAKILVTYVCSGVFLTAIGVYEHIVNFAGCGATVPLTGFGYTLANGIKKAVDEKGLLGVLTGGISATAGGIAAAICFGFIAALVFKSKPKK